MAPIPRSGGRSRVPLFFVLSLFAWAIWAPQALRRYDLIGWAPSLQSPLNALTVWAPGLAAMLLVWRESGRAGVAALFRRLARWRVPPVWYLAALLLEPGRWLLALGIDRLLGRDYALGSALLADAFGAAAAFMVPVAVVFTLPNALGEELGWRGFALPRLQERRGPLLASVVIGLFWGFWHVPAWIAWPNTEAAPLALLLMILNTVPAAVVFTWLFNRTGGSLLIVVIHHAAIANKGYFLPGLPTATEAVLLWIVAVLIVALRGLSPPGSRRAAAEPANGDASARRLASEEEP